MEKAELQTENDELRERLNSTQIHIEFMKKLVMSLDPQNPHTGHLRKTLNYLIAREMQNDINTVCR